MMLSGKGIEFFPDFARRIVRIDIVDCTTCPAARVNSKKLQIHIRLESFIKMIVM